MDIDDLINEIEGSLNNFNKTASKIQEDVLMKINLFIKELSVKNGNIQLNLENLRKIAKLKPAIEKAILSPAYQKKVKEFAESFNTVSKIQDSFFSGLVDDYTAPGVIEAVKNLAISDTIDSLTKRGLGQVTNKIADVIKTNITSKSNYNSLLKQVKELLTDTEGGDGLLVKHAKQVTTDSLNQYAANYTKIVTEDLSMDYFSWAGSLVDHSRDLCRELVKKKYIHKSEIPDILNGFINGKKIPIYDKTRLPYGMIPGTNATNFLTLRGGYQCNHLPAPISKFRVPKDIRAKFEKV